MMRFKIIILSALTMLVPLVPIQAQEKLLIDELVVTGHPLSSGGLSQATDALQGEELSRELGASIGETLARRPGMSSAQFGRAVGRPVIHGLAGPRVRIMEDRIDALDVSVASADHAVTIEPFIADRIEILKGANTLLYGSGAIGGVVNVDTGRIPQHMPSGLGGGGELRYDDNGAHTTMALKLSGGLGGSLAFRADGSFRRSDDYRIPGFVESAEQRAAEEPVPGEEHAQGVLAGSNLQFGSGGFGASWITGRGFAGVSISGIDAKYGLPGGHGHSAEGGYASIDLGQIRTDMEMEIDDPWALPGKLNVRAAYNSYQHKEIEPDGVIATTFNNNAWEGRAEWFYTAEPVQAALGLQHTGRRFEAVGEEAFIRPVNSFETGLFWVGQYSLGRFDLETGLRLGHVRHEPTDATGRDFFTWAVSAGAVSHWSDPLTIGVGVDISSRAPVAGELYANGPHLATGSYEIGNQELDNETAVNMSATIDYQGQMVQAMITGYGVWFGNFIYQQDGGEILDDLPVMNFVQDDAFFVGIDTELCVFLLRWNDAGLKVRAQLDHVHAVRVSGEALPRIPATRYGFGVEAQWNDLSVSIDYWRVAAQNQTGINELPTGGFDDLNASINYNYASSPFGDIVLFVQGKNLTDAEQRLHTSFIKDRAPQPGRSVEAGMRLVF